MNGFIIWGETLVTCSVQCEYQPPHIFAPAAGLNGIVYIIFNCPAVYFSSGGPEFFLFSLTQGHSARRVPWCPLTFLWLLNCYEATRTCVSHGCSPQRCASLRWSRYGLLGLGVPSISQFNLWLSAANINLPFLNFTAALVSKWI